MSVTGANGAPAVIEHEPSPRANGLAGVRVVQDFVPVLDTARFEHMQRIANVMASTSLVPESLRAIKDGQNWKPLPREQVLANCFLVVNQATRWGMDPFAVAQCCSVVHGKLTFEGKLVAAVLDAKLGVRLRYAWAGEGERMSITVSGTLDGVEETIDGSVADWRTTGTGTPWVPKNFRRMLAYRGAREWARLYAPAVMLGVYSEDEMEQLSRPMREVNPRPLTSPPPAPQLSGSRASIAPPPAPPADPPRRVGPPPAPPSPPPVETKPAPPLDTKDEDEAPIDAEAFLAHVGDELDCCGDLVTLDETWAGFADLIERMSRTDREAAQALYETNEKRIAAKLAPAK